MTWVQAKLGPTGSVFWGLLQVCWGFNPPPPNGGGGSGNIPAAAVPTVFVGAMAAVYFLCEGILYDSSLH
jgi:hypothetical protein